MVIDMETQNYFAINTKNNICENTVVWDGKQESWTLVGDWLLLPQTTTPAKVWNYDVQTKTWFLDVHIGRGNIGFTWGGEHLVTNEDQPTVQVTATPPSNEIPGSIL
jgi:hypothetical protein